MRIITGSARGITLKTVPGEEIVRPTTQKVKEAIFSAIQFDIEGRRILDLFAGSGQLGIEALSRGAIGATFIDSSAVSIAVIKENLEKAKLFDNAKVIKQDYLSFLLNCKDKFDIAFLDPPYHKGILEKAVLSVTDVMSDFGTIICEHPDNIDLAENANGFSVRKRYKYGKIAVTVYKKEQAN